MDAGRESLPAKRLYDSMSRVLYQLIMYYIF